MTLVAAATSTKTLWYVTRGTGVVALLLLTASLALGTLSSARWQTSRLPRFLVGGLHRNLTLLAVAFVAAHVITGCRSLRTNPLQGRDLLFLSPYSPIWLGLGTWHSTSSSHQCDEFDTGTAGRPHLARHPLAGLRLVAGRVSACAGTGSDARLNWMALVGFGSCVLVILALLVRVVRSAAPIGVRIPASVATLFVPLALFVWYLGGPARGGWAARAGTPTALLRRHATTVPSPSVPIVQRSLPPETFNGRLAGSLSQTAGASGLVKINIRAALSGDVRGKLRITLWVSRAVKASRWLRVMSRSVRPARRRPTSVASSGWQETRWRHG